MASPRVANRYLLNVAPRGDIDRHSRNTRTGPRPEPAIQGLSADELWPNFFGGSVPCSRDAVWIDPAESAANEIELVELQAMELYVCWVSAPLAVQR